MKSSNAFKNSLKKGVSYGGFLRFDPNHYSLMVKSTGLRPESAFD
jgi:hypothetical protein